MSRGKKVHDGSKQGRRRESRIVDRLDTMVADQSRLLPFWDIASSTNSALSIQTVIHGQPRFIIDEFVLVSVLKSNSKLVFLPK
jgi:hypothetical protein